MTENHLMAASVCSECGASKFHKQSACWLCKAPETNPFQSPSTLETIAAHQPPFGIARIVDNSVAAVLVGFAVLSAIGIFATDGVLPVVGYLLLMSPGILVGLSFYDRQRRRGATGFFASKTLAVITGGFAIFGTAVLLVIAGGVLLFAICAAMGGGPRF